MSFARNIWDGLVSLGTAVATVAVCGVPVWYTHKAAQSGIAPNWVYAPAAALAFVGVLMTLAFLRKASRGVSPGRERRR